MGFMIKWSIVCRLEGCINHDLTEKMVFLGGPRQVGKTTLALSLIEGADEAHPAYLNWDLKERKLYLWDWSLCGDESARFENLWR